MKDYKIIVYTCNVGHYDSYRSLIYLEQKYDIKFIYFTDEPVSLRGWEVVQVDTDIISDKTKLARYYKINSTKVLPKHDYSLWVDCRFDIDLDYINEFIKTYKEYDLTCFDYPRNALRSLYDEADTIIDNGLDDIKVVMEQVGRYKIENLPRNVYIGSTGIILRKSNSSVTEFNDLWWNEVKKYSKRDQVSQFYAVWKTGIKHHKIIEGTVYKNGLISKVLQHRHKDIEAKELTDNERRREDRKRKAILIKKHRNELSNSRRFSVRKGRK